MIGPVGSQWSAGYDTTGRYRDDGDMAYRIGRVLHMGMGSPLEAYTYYVASITIRVQTPLATAC